MSKSYPIFDNSSTDEFSPAFPVFPGSTVIISAWNLPRYIQLTKEEELTNAKPKNMPMLAIVQKMAFTAGLYPENNLCESEGFLLPGIEYSFVEDVTSCGLWNLNACQNLVAINIPGTYRVRLNDVSAVGNVHITVQSIPNTELFQASSLIYLS